MHISQNMYIFTKIVVFEVNLKLYIYYTMTVLLEYIDRLLIIVTGPAKMDQVGTQILITFFMFVAS